MTTFTWFNGNQGAYRYLDFERYTIDVSADGTVITGIYNGRDGDLDETRQPARFSATVENPVSAVTGEGVQFYTDGTITTITYYNSDDEMTMQGTGLTVSAAVFGAYLLADEPYGIEHLFKSYDMTLIGAENSQSDDWEGDDIFTGQGNDTVMGNGGNDYIKDGGGIDHYDGGEGWDTLAYNDVFYSGWLGKRGIRVDLREGEVRGPDGNIDTVENIEEIRGTFRKDVMLGSGADERFVGLQGRDVFNGRGGFDRVRYDKDEDQGGLNGVVVNLGKGFAIDGFGQRDTLKNIEGARGTDFDDVFRDSNGGNYFDGRDGDDLFIFKRGNDSARGGDGADTFRYVGTKIGDNYIRDFEVGVDKIHITHADQFSDLAIENNGEGRAVISFGNGQIELDGVLTSELSDSDFIF